jgi:dephospho-CoA kinase
VFGDRDALRQLEQILNPAIRHRIDSRIAASTAAVVVLDAIRLIEAGLAARCDAVWVVVCDPAMQAVRLRESRGFSEEQAALRIAAQTAQDEKARHATALIRNDGTLQELEREVDQAWLATVAPQGAQSSPP